MVGSAPGPGSAAASDRVHEALAALLCACALALLLWRSAGFFHDDAYITLRYVARWIGGHGLGWNDGERVEGFTHPWWLLQLSALGACGAPLPGAARGLGLAYLAALFAIFPAIRASWAGALLLATQPALALWVWGGLETVSFCFWVAVAVLLAERASRGPEARAAWAGLAFAAAALTRPEGAGVGALAAAGLWFTRRRGASLRLLAGLLAPLLVVEVARWLWFGDWLPNSARAKLGGAPLLETWQLGFAYLVASWAVWAPAAGVALVALALRRHGRPALELAGVALLVAALLSGGDHMPGGRFALPAAVLFALAAGRRLRGLDPRPRTLALGCVALAAVAQLAGGRALPRELDPAARVGERVGRFLSEHLPPGALVATATAGSTPFFAPELRFIDTLGLNDRQIARRNPVPLETRWQRVPGHRKGDGAYVLSRAPDVVILGPAEGYLGAPARAWFLGDFELITSAEFHARYRPVRFALGKTSDLVLTAWLRRDSPAAEQLASLGEPLRPPPLRTGR